MFAFIFFVKFLVHVQCIDNFIIILVPKVPVNTCFILIYCEEKTDLLYVNKLAWASCVQVLSIFVC